MSYRVLTLNYKIGDAGVTQSDDGSGGNTIGINVSATPVPFGWTILNIVNASAMVGVLGGGPVIGAPTDDGVAPWSISAAVYNEGVPPPLAFGTLVLTVTAIAGS